MTTDQLTIDDAVADLLRDKAGHWRGEDRETSMLAAKMPGHGRGKALVLIALYHADAEGLTDYEAGERTGLLRTSAGKRRKDLMKLWLVEQSDPLRRRTTDTGADAIVWEISATGVDLIEKGMEDA